MREGRTDTDGQHLLNFLECCRYQSTAYQGFYHRFPGRKAGRWEVGEGDVKITIKLQYTDHQNRLKLHNIIE